MHTASISDYYFSTYLGGPLIIPANNYRTTPRNHQKPGTQPKLNQPAELLYLTFYPCHVLSLTIIQLL